MQEQTSQDYQAVQRFAQELLNKKYYDIRALKDTQKACRSYIEKKLSKNSDIQKFLPPHKDQSSLMKNLIVNYTLMKMIHHAALWEIETHNPEGENPLLSKSEQELFAKFDEHCAQAFEIMKADDVLIQMALKTYFNEFKTNFLKVMHGIITDDFKDNSVLQDFYNTHRGPCLGKMNDYISKFYNYAKDWHMEHLKREK